MAWLKLERAAKQAAHHGCPTWRRVVGKCAQALPAIQRHGRLADAAELKEEQGWDHTQYYWHLQGPRL